MHERYNFVEFEIKKTQNIIVLKVNIDLQNMSIQHH